MPFADLHTHTHYSDGALSPADLVGRARAAGVGVLAVTDHDTLAGLPEAVEAGRRAGVEIVPGAELSITVGEQEVHLLALGVDPGHAGLRAHVEHFRTVREDRARAMAERLRAAGVAVTFEAILAHAGKGVIGRPHVARAVVDAGGAETYNDAFDRYLREGAPAYVGKERFDGRDAIRLVHAAGGVAVVAHAALLPDDTALEALMRQGLDGVEVVHPAHNWAAQRHLAAYARRYGLLETGGSDYHGHRPGDDARLGRYGVDAEGLGGLRRAA